MGDLEKVSAAYGVDISKKRLRQAASEVYHKKLKSRLAIRVLIIFDDVLWKISLLNQTNLVMLGSAMK